MAIPKNIERKHIEQAIAEIIPSSIPSSRHGVHYSMDENGKSLPIKYVISVANKYANGQELNSDHFTAVDAKRFLSNLGLKVRDHRNELSAKRTNIWVEKTIVENRPDRIRGKRALGKVLWSPQRDIRGADIYKNMRLVDIGDIIIHLIDNKTIAGVSVVKQKAAESSGVKGTDWDVPSYVIELEEYQELNPKLNRSEVLNSKHRKELDQISQKSEVFYNNKLNLRQGAYLTPCPQKLAVLLNDIYHTKTGGVLPHFDNLPMDSKATNENESFLISALSDAIHSSGLRYHDQLLTRFTASLLTKPFVILTGLSGSGKTKLAQAFVQWICQDESQYRIIPVGADWTNREPLLGYPNALEPEKYVKPDSGVLDLVMQANERRELPHFLILDEMNLSHVERYFADFLSVMESKEAIPLYSKDTVIEGMSFELSLPANLFIIGTVNIDETTNMFSPKVLDRANTIEFRIDASEMESFLGNIRDINMESLNAKGAGMAASFLQLAENKEFAATDNQEINTTLLQFFTELQKTGAEFGYRSATEILRLLNQLTVLDPGLAINEKLDIAIMQKLLPKLHGSRRKLCPVLETLGTFCVSGDIKIIKNVFDKEGFDFQGDNVLYPLSLEKIARMYKGATDNGFTSFAEA